MLSDLLSLEAELTSAVSALEQEILDLEELYFASPSSIGSLVGGYGCPSKKRKRKSPSFSSTNSIKRARISGGKAKVT